MEQRTIELTNMADAIKIYNSNTNFLIHHIGEDHIDESFLKNELEEMQAHGFTSNYILVDNEPIGILDYMINGEGYVYLSLMMITKEKQKNGLGTAVYNFFEEMIRNSGAQIIRIDVVDDYENNVLPFWKKLGFEAKRRDELTWGNKKSSVSVMEKVL
ncbi:Acetyltransferase (GNAT) domain-containing protein [Pseudobutyrivibrio sp. JW11]|uniref:GNAT family N-acetyltransferase n=1 Tax=Pseudobutyrivibrio sp. JW11 TaxID=1855302 RepID=UPI0008F1B59C|nr:GNAT family N-acetyltransferase [Pseudobutyrivibrio sp. JW11]SFO18991.1 Acetyltransferase (GNAT) domain-containing protein [Pseudobutyrivibrio sp. JW11]